MSISQFPLAQESNPADDVGQAVDSVSNWWSNPVTQEWLINKPIIILITLLVAIIAHAVLRRLINRLAKRNIDNGGKKKKPISSILKRGRAEEEETRQLQLSRQAQEQRRQSRIRTLSSVGKSTVAIVVWVFAVLSILQTIGVNVGPLIASAGVIGVALGFGAQSLVKDFLSGIFMLVEDQYGVGDTIDVGEGIVGDVEEISLRVTTVRDIDGTLWYIRNGEILRVGNFSDEFSIARIQVPVGLTNDADHAWNVILESAVEGASDPKIEDAIMEAPEMNGLTSLESDQMSFRVSVKTLPGQQWAVQRFLQAKVVNDLSKAGITMPYPHGIGAVRPTDIKNAEEG